MMEILNLQLRYKCNWEIAYCSNRKTGRA